VKVNTERGESTFDLRIHVSRKTEKMCVTTSPCLQPGSVHSSPPSCRTVQIGQKINKTSSTVWLRHEPTGVEVRCQAERSQSVNREVAWAELCDRLEARERQAIATAKQVREAERRRTRQKSYGQKVRMIESKKRRAKIKAKRGRPGGDW
jgi:hypothetical protein